MLRIFQQHGAQFLDRLSDCLGLKDFDSLDVIGLVQKKAAVSVHENTIILFPILPDLFDMQRPGAYRSK